MEDESRLRAHDQQYRNCTFAFSRICTDHVCHRFLATKHRSTSLGGESPRLNTVPQQRFSGGDLEDRLGGGFPRRKDGICAPQPFLSVIDLTDRLLVDPLLIQAKR